MNLGELAGLAAAACWAGTTLLVRGLAGRLSVVGINVWRAGTAGLFAVLTLLVFRPGALADGVPLWALGLILLSVLCAPGVGDTLYFTSLRLIGVARAMPLSGTNPLFAAVFAVLFLHEEITPQSATGIGLVVLSIYLVAAGRGGQVHPRDARLGIALALAAAVLWAAGTISIRPALTQLDLLLVNAIRLPMTALVVGAYAWRTGQLAGPRSLKRRDLTLLLAIGAITAFSTLLFLTSVQWAGAARASALTSTAPIFGAPLALLIYREALTVRLIAGILVSVLGIALLVGG